jgi:ABC-2 type transport system ATP-binding protein
VRAGTSTSDSIHRLYNDPPAGRRRHSTCPLEGLPVPLLQFSRLRKAYATTVAVDDVTFEVRPGEVFGLLGPNGAGKTTLLRMLIDIMAPDSGEILFEGRPLGPQERERIGYLPEERGLYRKERVVDILIYFGMLKGLARRVARERAMRWLDRVGLQDAAGRRADTLSKGMQQKVQITGTLLHEPQILVMDEPFSGLDPLNTVLVKDILRERRDAGALVILSTHQMPMVEELCDRVAMIDRGRLVLYGDLEEIRRSHGGSAVLVGTDADLSGLPPVAGVERQGGLRKVRLRAGARPRDLMAIIEERRIPIDHFEVARMSVEEIFVSTVRARAADPAPPPVVVPAAAGGGA